MAHCNTLGHRNLNGSSLLFYSAGAMNQAVIYEAVRRIVCRLRTRLSIQIVQTLSLAIFEERGPHGFRISHECNSVCPRPEDVTSGYLYSAVITVDKYCIPAQPIQKTFLQTAVLGPGERDGSAPID